MGPSAHGAAAADTSYPAAPGSTVMLGSFRIAASGADSPMYAGPAALEIMGATSANPGGQAHENRMPCLPINYCIYLNGPFPS